MTDQTTIKPPEGGCVSPPVTEAKPPKPPSTPLLECFHNTVGCKAVALHAKDATEKGWYEDTLKVWYCQDHGRLKRAADEHNRRAAR